MNNAHNIITTIQAAGAEELVDIIATLEDGEALASLGFTDEDTADIEEAHHMALSMSKAPFDMARIQASLEGPFIELPPGLNRAGIRAFILAKAKELNNEQK